jgi:hypothetical protein
MAAMTQGDWDSTIDRLIAATTDAREVITEAHGVTRDLRQALAEARELLARTVPEAVSAELNGRLKEVVDEAVTVLGEATTKAINASVVKVGREFSRLERVFLGTDAQARREGKPSIEQLAVRRAALGDVPAAFRKDVP